MEITRKLPILMRNLPTRTILIRGEARALRSSQPPSWLRAAIPPPALGEGRYGGVARRSVTVCWAALFVLADVQCPHPRPCYGHVRPEEAANNFAVGQDVEIVIAPVAGGTPCAFQSEVILLHRDAPDLVAESTPAPPEGG
jgi:hypothetical protein